MGTFIKVKHRRAICFKFGDIILIFLIKVVLEAKDRSTIKKNLLLYCRKFLVFAIVAMI